MKTILIIGAGKSSTALIDYLTEQAKPKNRQVILADISLDLAEKKLKGKPQTKAVSLNIEEEEERQKLIKEADVVVSMLPAFLHGKVAMDCLAFEKHFFSASYESEELKVIADQVRKKNLFFLNECGLDPGIDHMSAMRIIDHEKKSGNEIVLFKSFTGGLLAPECEDNPWKYKFTWNPRNVVLAGKGVSRFIRNGRLKFIPYHMLFRRTEKISFEDVGDFDGYPNRDSLSYRKVYGLENIPTILRGTLRREGFCKSWDVFVQLGLTDDSFQMDLPEDFTMRMFINTFLPYHPDKSVETKLMEILPHLDEDTMNKLEWLGILGHESLPRFKGSPAEILQEILESKWQLLPNDKDMIVMQHQLEINTGQGQKVITSSLVIKGENQDQTAMSKTVGLPLAIAVDLFLEDRFSSRGLMLPIHEEIYEPILKELEKHGIVFKETETVAQT
ncbi:saccharopine dehydrogenase family protein [Pararhodonellum marinum]|uniref:saccharopine dehydrogenase family protein n=1 Tax=Pararhodonellum marinum TaxID=2755358 RepID=UPI0018906A62|nr:saccharopine dehydrogenase C-terminal domain-containing protein [Pararhodonellum marinum]